jgi:hypothetical protein
VNSFPETVRELWQLVRSYAMQELYAPLKGLPMYILLGLGGAFSVVLGVGLLALGVLRFVQTEFVSEGSRGSATALPYFLVSIGSFVAMYVFAKRINRQFKAPS